MLLVEVDLHKFPKPARVIVPHSLSIPETLEQRVGCYDPLLDMRRTPPVQLSEISKHVCKPAQ